MSFPCLEVCVTIKQTLIRSLSLSLPPPPPPPPYHLTQAVDYGTIRIGRSCLNPDHAPSVNESVSLEVYSSDSRCFDQMEPFVRTDEDESEVKGSTYGAGCYQVRKFLINLI